MTDFLDANGCVPESPRPPRIIGYLGSIVAAVTTEPSKWSRELPMKCRRRPNRKPCPGTIRAGFEPATRNIIWGAAAGVDPGILLDGILRGVSPFLVMVATYGIIGEDVRHGYFRFLFAKPISPVLYYAQACLAALIAFLSVQLIVVALFALAVEPAWPERWLLERTAFFLSFGSVIFALSRVLPIDWLIGLPTY